MTGHARARRRDRRVYLAGHPVLLALLAATRRRPVLRLGPVVLVHDEQACRQVLTGLPLDRLGAGTTGAAVAAAGGGGLFDQTGEQHRTARRDLGVRLASRELRAVWQAPIDRTAATLAGGGRVDLVALAAEVGGSTAAAVLDLDVDPLVLAAAARATADATAAAHLPGRRARPVPTTLTDLVGTAAAATTAVATVSTAVAAFPRAVAWTADAGLWDAAADPVRRTVLVAELLRVTAASPLLPRVAAADGEVAGCPVRRGDRMLLVTRHAAAAHVRNPSVADPAAPAQQQLVFGAGGHACPGAGVARAQLGDLLAALAPSRPRVVSARADRRSALPSWASLVVEATR